MIMRMQTELTTEEKVNAIVAMGFPRKRAESALQDAGGSVDRALTRLLTGSAGRQVLAAALSPDGFGAPPSREEQAFVGRGRLSWL